MGPTGFFGGSASTAKYFSVGFPGPVDRRVSPGPLTGIERGRGGWEGAGKVGGVAKVTPQVTLQVTPQVTPKSNSTR